MELSDIEIGALVKFFNQDGYVLDFSTADFDAFTFESIGVPLCAQYKLSKGKSLIQYVHNAPKNDVQKLLLDLMTHYELSGLLDNDIENNKSRSSAYNRCRTLLDKISNSVVHNISAEKLKKEFNSEYISQQIDLMVGMQSENPTEAIGKAKELIESCCKTILEKKAVAVDKNWDVPRLTKETFKVFRITPNDISDEIVCAKSIKQILGNLNGIAQGIAELRNTYGSGHGKSATYKGLEARHAKLAVGSSITLVNFLWDSFERDRKSGTVL
ncbi:MAG: abortive infection family protein [Phocaeicola sp.]